MPEKSNPNSKFRAQSANLNRKSASEEIQLDSRPNVQSLIVQGENAEKNILQRPFASVMILYKLIVLQILRQFLVLHQPPLRFHRRLLLIITALRHRRRGRRGASRSSLHLTIPIYMYIYSTGKMNYFSGGNAKASPERIFLSPPRRRRPVCVYLLLRIRIYMCICVCILVL